VPDALLVRLEAPVEVELGRESPAVRVALIQGKDDILTQVVVTPGNTVVVSTPPPIGTPGPLVNARGPRYQGMGRAVLEAGQFEKEPEEQNLRPLDSPLIEWSWIITPQSEGTHTITVIVQIEWTPIDGTGQPLIDRIFSHSMDIKVTKPFLTYGELQIGTLLSGFLGSVLSAPFIYQVWKEVKARRNREEGLD
jgi:hypothetical protein